MVVMKHVAAHGLHKYLDGVEWVAFEVEDGVGNPLVLLNSRN
jgi:hypothetical protein